jgi:hypothetical protein
VITFDPEVHVERERYLELLDPETRSLIRLVRAGTEEGPSALEQHEPPAVEVLFIDGDHGREGALAAFEAWREVLAPGAVVALHDYGDPDYPGVAEAVADLGLEGNVHGTLFACRVRA